MNFEEEYGELAKRFDELSLKREELAAKRQENRMALDSAQAQERALQTVLALNARTREELEETAQKLELEEQWVADGFAELQEELEFAKDDAKVSRREQDREFEEFARDLAEQLPKPPAKPPKSKRMAASRKK